MSLGSDVDPDIAAAFSSSPDASAASTNAIDPDIAEAFQSPNKKGRKAPGNEVTSGPLGFINGLAETAGKGIANVPYAAAHGAVDLYRRATGGDTNAPDPAMVRSLAFPLSDNARDAVSSLGSIADRLPGDPTSGDVNEAKTFGLTPFERGGTAVLGDIASIAPMASAIRGIGGFLSDAKTLAPRVALDPQGIVDRAYAGQSMGAAGAAPKVATASPELQRAIAQSAQKTGGAVNPDVLTAHLEADEHGIQLSKGQATRDPNQFSEEQNSTHKDIVQRLNQQNGQIVDAIDNIRRDASPTNVANSARENGQAVLDDLKAYDEPKKAEITAAYDDANQSNIAAGKGALKLDPTPGVKHAADALEDREELLPSEGRSILEKMRAASESGEGIPVKQAETWKTIVSRATRKYQQSGDTNAVTALSDFRDSLEAMTPSNAAAGVVDKFNKARALAKARFDTMAADPAYAAAVNDSASKGHPSALADTFLDDYALNRGAPKSQLDSMMSKLSDEGRGAVASHTLSAIRKSAVNASGNVVPNGYNTAMAKYADKLPSLVEPDTIDKLQSLGRTITRLKVAPPGNYVNYSKSGVIMNAAGSAAEHALNAKTGGIYGLGKKLLTGDKFAKEALAPGAGLDQLQTKP